MQNDQSVQLKRKRRRIRQMIGIVLGMCVIAAEVVYLTDGFGQAAAVEQNGSPAAQNAGKDNTPKQVAVNAAATEPETTQKRTYENYVFVGDSRYVGMSVYAQAEDTFIAKNNMGYSYLVEQTNNILRVCNENTALIIGLGVNDLRYSSNNYIAKINELAQTMDCQIYYMLVNPVDETKEESYGYSILNTEINEFNQKMKRGLSSRVIVLDTNSYLKQIGYSTQDGLHYTKETYGKIYEYIKAQL